MLRHIKQSCGILLAIVVLCVNALAGCSTLPVPEEFSGHRSYEIVQHIRCEMRESIRSYLRGALNEAGQKDLTKRLLESDLTYKGLLNERVNEGIRRLIERYRYSEIGYEFTFNINEKNTATATASVLRPFLRGSDGIGFSASSDLQRRNIRNFRIFDEFGWLVFDFPDRFCKDERDKNLLYPITGRIGLANTVGNFLDLNQSGNLQGSKATPSIPASSDTITFTTTLGGSVSPGFNFSPLGATFELAAAGAKFDASRQDMHEVIVVLTHPDPYTRKPRPQLIAQQRVAAEQELSRQRYIANGLSLTTIGRGVLQTVQ